LVPVREEFRALLDDGRLLMRGSAPYTDWDTAVQAIVSSYVHMMNNRLGISLQEESYLAYLIMRAMGRPADAVTA
ncbi:MAG TPA: lantibiotic dehydratase C-terminal domain-containing protein, partial [Longimicrobium sp.]|nr:lantibiotic dehydratase C-terminal domain-containing protein [Longimicrobium sp.]